jgi:excisionase family DNA binding protein
VITVKQAAELLGITDSRVRQYLLEDRIKGARKIGRDWLLPDKPVIRPPKNPRGGQAKKSK